MCIGSFLTLKNRQITVKVTVNRFSTDFRRFRAKYDERLLIQTGKINGHNGVLKIRF